MNRLPYKTAQRRDELTRARVCTKDRSITGSLTRASNCAAIYRMSSNLNRSLT